MEPDGVMASWPNYRRRVHEQALRLSRHGWRILLGVPDVCLVLGTSVPRWALELLDHAHDLGHEAPTDVMNALTEERYTAACASSESRGWGTEVGLWDPRRLQPALLDVTALGDAVRIASCGRRSDFEVNPAERAPLRAADLLEPFKPLRPGEEPLVVEDGTKGTVVFKTEMSEGVGPAWLVRGDRYEILFRGRWVEREVAQQYAREYEHEFS